MFSGACYFFIIYYICYGISLIIKFNKIPWLKIDKYGKYYISTDSDSYKPYIKNMNYMGDDYYKIIWKYKDKEITNLYTDNNTVKNTISDAKHICNIIQTFPGYYGRKI